MKKVLIFILICILLAVIVIFNFNDKDNKNLEITVSTNGGVPYEWKYEIEDKAIVSFVKKYAIEKSKNLEGGKVDINFVFKGLKKGTTTIKLQYVSLIDNSIEKEQKYYVIVDKYNNISLRTIIEEE